MAATRANINWAAVTFGTTSISRVTSGAFGLGGKLLTFRGDVDLYNTVVANVVNEPHAAFTTADVGTMMGLAPGATATLAATLNDAKGAVGGAVVFTLNNAVFESAQAQAHHAQFGSVVGTWQAFSSDGVTNPLSITRQ